MKCGRNFNLLTSTRTPGDRLARLRRGNYTYALLAPASHCCFFAFSLPAFIYLFSFSLLSPTPGEMPFIRTYTHAHTHTHTHGFRLITVPQRLKHTALLHFPRHTPLTRRRRRQIHRALWDPQRSRIRKQSK